jgi:hypothetical protein
LVATEQETVTSFTLPSHLQISPTLSTSTRQSFLPRLTNWNESNLVVDACNYSTQILNPHRLGFDNDLSTMSGPPLSHSTNPALFNIDMFADQYEDVTPTEPLLNSEENGYLSSFYQNVQQQGHLPNNMLAPQNVTNDEMGWLISEPAPNVQQVLLSDSNRNHLVNQGPMSAYPHARQPHSHPHHQGHSPFLQPHYSPDQMQAPPSMRTQQHSVPRLDTNPARLSLSTNPHNIYIAPQSAPPIGRSNPRLYQFGSDQRFNNNGFIPAFEAERHQAREEHLTHELKRLIPINRTPRASRHPSPEAAHSSRKRRLEDAPESPADTKRSRRTETTSPISAPRPTLRGRRASLRGRGGSAVASTPMPSRRLSTPEEAETAAQASARKRENLNEEQKRQSKFFPRIINHNTDSMF